MGIEIFKGPDSSIIPLVDVVVGTVFVAGNGEDKFCAISGSVSYISELV